jgi:hypothetical protein
MPKQMWQSSVDGTLFSTEEECRDHEESHLAAKAVPLLVKECGDLFFKGEGEPSLFSEYFGIRVLRVLGIMPLDIWKARDEILMLADIADYLRQVRNVSPAFGKRFLAGKCQRFTLGDLLSAVDDFGVLSAALKNVMRSENVPFLAREYGEVGRLSLNHYHPSYIDAEDPGDFEMHYAEEEAFDCETHEAEELAMRAEFQALSDPFEGSPC